MFEAEYVELCAIDLDLLMDLYSLLLPSNTCSNQITLYIVVGLFHGPAQSGQGLRAIRRSS